MDFRDKGQNSGRMWEAEAAENQADAGGREMKSVDGVSKDIFSQKLF